MDSSQDSDDRKRKESGVHYDSPPLGQPFIRQPYVEDTVHESEDELDDVDPPEEDPSLQAEDIEAPAAEEFPPPPPPETMAMEENEMEDEDREPGSEESHENEPEEVAEGDSIPLVNEDTDPSNKVTVSESDHDDDEIELTEIPDPQPPQPAQENDLNRPGQSLNYVESVRARYVQRSEDYYNEEKEGYTKLCWTCICFVLLASIIGFLLAVALVPNLDPLSSAVVTEGPAGNGDVLLAEVMVTLDLDFTDYLYDPASEQYKELEAEYLVWVQQIVRKTSFAGDAFGAFVNGFRPGSVIVHSSVFFNLSNNTSLTNLESNLANELNSALETQEASITLPVEEVAVGQVIPYSEDTKRPIEIFATSPRPQTNQPTVTPSTQGSNSTPMVGASSSTITPSSSLSQSLGTNTMSSPPPTPPVSPSRGITSRGMQAASTATRGTTATPGTTAASSNVTSPAATT